MMGAVNRGRRLNKEGGVTYIPNHLLTKYCTGAYLAHH